MIDLPSNTDAERATLGCVFLNRDAIVSIATWLTPAHFSDVRTALIYQAMLDCYRAGVAPNNRTVEDRLRTMGKFSEVGFEYLLHLDDGLPHGLDVETYARQVEREAIKRQLVIAGGKIAAIGYNATDHEQALDEAQGVLTAAATMRSSSSSIVPFSQIAEEEYANIEAEVIPGIPTGFIDLDEITGGLHRQDLIILAARPSQGKTSLAGCLACNVADRAGLPVLLFSLEMGRRDILMRAAAMASGVNLQSVRQRRMSDRDTTEYMKALGWAAKQPIYVDDTATQTLMHIRNKALRFLVEHGQLGLIIVDYLQLMDYQGKTENRVQEVSKISRGLKQLARETDTPVLALSQLSRAVEGRTSHVPMLSDLRESGSIEQDADLVMFIYREEVYDHETDKKGVAELHIAKHRNGPLGVVPLRFDTMTTRFTDLAPRYRDDDGNEA